MGRKESAQPEPASSVESVADEPQTVAESAPVSAAPVLEDCDTALADPGQAPEFAPVAEPDVAASADDDSAENAPPRRAVASTHWRQWLAGSSPREVLARLMQGDPLGIRKLVAERLRQRCYLCDADRVYLRAVARTARFALRYRGQPELGVWLSGIVDEAVLDVLRDELEFARSAGARVDEAAGAQGSAFVDLARPLGLDPAAVRCACARFDHLPENQRAAFFGLLVEHGELDLVARRLRQTPTEVARAARLALETLLASHDAHTRSQSNPPNDAEEETR